MLLEPTLLPGAAILDPSCQSYMFYSPAPIRIPLAGPLAPSLSLSAQQCVRLVSASYPAPHTLQDVDLRSKILRLLVLMQVKMLTCSPGEVEVYISNNLLGDSHVTPLV